MIFWRARKSGPLRFVAALIAGVLISTQALAAAQACVVFAGQMPAMHDCADAEPGAQPAAAQAQHCPAEDPSAQTRSIELPAASTAPLFVVVWVLRTNLQPPTPVALAHDALPRFAELNRRLL